METTMSMRLGHASSRILGCIPSDMATGTPEEVDVEQAALLLDLLWCPGRHVRRYAAVNHVEHIHHVPFLALSGMDRREDEIVVVEVRMGGFIPHSVGWVKRQLAQEPLARGVARGELL